VIEPLALDDRAARDAAAVGSKAALLALAADAGLPVLPGVVVPMEASGPAIGAGAEALRSRGRAQAYLAASAVASTGVGVDVLGSLGPSLVVRSSTVLDTDGRWSGAFASYLDVGPTDAAAAIRGCRASVFTRDVLERCEATGTDPASLRVAVLVQPYVRFAFGGTARIDAAGPDARVTVTVGRGGAHGVVGGDRASTAIVDPAGGVQGAADVPTAVVVNAAALARRALEATGIGAIEWGATGEPATGERLVLFQVGPAPHANRVARPATRVAPAALPAGVDRVAAIVAAFRGPLGDELVLPWALVADRPPRSRPIVVDDVPRGIDEVRQLSRKLTTDVWGPGGEPIASSALRDLRGGATERAIATLGRARPPDRDLARRIVSLIDGMGVALEARGVLRAAEVAWQLTTAELVAAAGGTPPTPHAGPDRWEPFLVEAAFARGTIREGVAIADGVGAGRLHVVTSLREIGRPGPRAIISAPAPLPQLAPLLWHCAGFVAHGGSAGAHLFEVAHSLGVPAVIGIAPDDLGLAGSLVAVDGSAGVVASLEGITAARRPA
jgi:hypothetical protein